MCTCVCEYPLDEMDRVRKDVREGRSINNGVLSFAVLYHIIGKVEEIQAVIIVSWKKVNKTERIRFEWTLPCGILILKCSQHKTAVSLVRADARE